MIVPTTGTGGSTRSGRDRWSTDVQRRHRPGRPAVLLSAELDFVPGRPGKAAGGRPRRCSTRSTSCGRGCPGPATRSCVLFGESLGSLGGQGAFGWLPDIAQMGFSSVLWVGPPNASPLWRAITERRDPGTPEVAAALRQRTHRPLLRRRPALEIADDTARRGRAPAWCTCSTRPIRSCGGRRICCSPGRTGWRSSRAVTARHALVPVRDVLAGGRRHGVLDRGSGRPRPQLRRLRARRLGGVAPPDGWTPEQRRIRTALEKTEAADARILVLAGRFGRWRSPWSLLAGGPGAAAPSALAPAPTVRRVPHWSSHPGPVGVARPSYGRDYGTDWRWSRWWCAVLGATTALPVVRAAMADRGAGPPGPLAAAAVPLGTVWAEEEACSRRACALAAEGSARRSGRLLQSAAFGLWHIADARNTVSPWSARYW